MLALFNVEKYSLNLFEFFSLFACDSADEIVLVNNLKILGLVPCCAYLMQHNL